MLDDDMKASLCLSKATCSDIVNMLPNLANYCVRALRGKGPNIDGEVLQMRQGYGTGFPLGGMTSSRNFVNEATLLFAPVISSEYSSWKHIPFPLVDEIFDKDKSSEISSLTDCELSCLQTLQDRFNDPHRHVGVLFIELITSDEVRGMRRTFLIRLRALCTEHNVILVLDDCMISIRCGYLFSFMFYKKDFIPDFVLVGKHWGPGYLFKLSSCGIDDRILHGLSGIATCPVDNLSILKTIMFLEVVRDHKIIHHCYEIGKELKKNRNNEAYRIFGLKSNTKVRARVQGIGVIFKTDLYFGRGISSENLEFQRILPPFDIEIPLLISSLRTVLNPS